MTRKKDIENLLAMAIRRERDLESVEFIEAHSLEQGASRRGEVLLDGIVEGEMVDASKKTAGPLEIAPRRELRNAFVPAAPAQRRVVDLAVEALQENLLR